MFERLRRYRTDRERYVSKIEEFQKKVEDLDSKIRAEEASTIVGVMNFLNLTPEKAAEMLGYHEEEKKPAPKKNTSEKKETTGINGQNTVKNDDNKDLEDVLNEVY